MPLYATASVSVLLISIIIFELIFEHAGSAALRRRGRPPCLAVETFPDSESSGRTGKRRGRQRLLAQVSDCCRSCAGHCHPAQLVTPENQDCRH